MSLSLLFKNRSISQGGWGGKPVQEQVTWGVEKREEASGSRK